MIAFEIANEASSPLVEVKFAVDYLGSDGAALGRWTSLHRGAPIARDGASGKFSELAMKVPPGARKSRATLLRAKLADGTTYDFE